jgi:hypothetical protein
MAVILVTPIIAGTTQAYLAQRNADPRPYKWKPECAAILEKIQRARAALNRARAAA